MSPKGVVRGDNYYIEDLPNGRKLVKHGRGRSTSFGHKQLTVLELRLLANTLERQAVLQESDEATT